MRKFFALALAVAMVLSLASVSFAALPVNTVADVDLVGPWRYDADGDTLASDLRYGSGVLYLIKIDEDPAAAYADDEADEINGAYITAYKEIEKLKVKAEFEQGEDLVKSVSIVKKYVNDGVAGITNGNYYYFVEFMMNSSESVNEADVVATLEFNRKADDDVNAKAEAGVSTGIGKIKDDKVEAEFTVFHAKNYNMSDGTGDYKFDDTNDSTYLKYDTNYALKFSCDDEVEIPFGKDGEENEGTFTVDVSGQGKVFLKYNTKANEAIVNANPGVEMYFVNFNNCKFNRVGEFVYEMEDMVAAYKVVGDELVEIKGLEIDSEEAIFNTRVLESYVFATAELVNPAAAVEAPVVEAPAVTNPSTGA